MIRTFLVCLSIALFLVFTIILWPIEWIIGKISPRAKDLSMLRILQGYFRIVMFLSGTRVTVIGKELVPKDRAVLYIINHRSVFDIIVTMAYLPGLTGYIAKKNFEKVPLLSWWLRWTHGFFLDRENIREGLKTILAAIDNVKQGISVAIFPEGTRNRNDQETDLLPFHEGSFKIATKTGCPIVPVCLNHTHEILEKDFPKIRGTHVIMEYKTPIDPAALTGEDKKFPGKYVHGLMTETITRNHAL